MPFQLRTNFHHEYPQSFYINDGDDIELVGAGFRFAKSSFTIKNILGYGYNDTSVVVICTDSLDKKRYINSYKIGHNSTNDHPEISFKDLSDIGFEQVKTNYKWIEIDIDKIINIESHKFMSLLGILFSSLLLIWQLFKL
jgi:hypothetical protein